MIYKRPPWETAQALEHYSTIYADPPWRFRDKAAAGKRGVEFKYRTMTLEQNRELPVSLIAGPNSALHLWVPASMLPDGLRVLGEWGFRFQTVSFVWVKLLQNILDRLMAFVRRGVVSTSELDRLVKVGMGNWTRNQVELCLLGLRGRPLRESKAVRQVVLAPWRLRGEQHSAKPREVRDRIVALGPEGPRIELFAREEGAGWDAWGLELMAGSGELEEPLRDV